MVDPKGAHRHSYRRYCYAWRLGRAQWAEDSILADDEKQDSSEAKAIIRRAIPAPPAAYPPSFDITKSSAINRFVADLSPSFYRTEQTYTCRVNSTSLREMVPEMVASEMTSNSMALTVLSIEEALIPGFQDLSANSKRVRRDTYRSLRLGLSRREYETSPNTVFRALLGLIASLYLLGSYVEADVHIRAVEYLLAAVRFNGGEKLDSHVDQEAKSVLAFHKAARTIGDFGTSHTASTGDGSHGSNFSLPDLLPSLPKGFSNPSVSCQLSIDCMQLLKDVATWSYSLLAPKDLSIIDDKNNLHIAMAVRLLQSRPQSTQDEKLVLLATAAYCVFMTGSVNSCFMVNCFIQVYCKTCQIFPLGECDVNLTFWSGAMLRSVYGRNSFTFAFSNSILERIDLQQRVLMLSGKGLERLYDFFWNPSLTLALKENS